MNMSTVRQIPDIQYLMRMKITSEVKLSCTSEVFESSIFIYISTFRSFSSSMPISATKISPQYSFAKLCT